MILERFSKFFNAVFGFCPFLSVIKAHLELSKSCMCYTTQLLVLVLSHKGKKELAQQLYFFLF